MEKSTKKVLVVAGVTITLGTGGYIGYKVIKNKRIRAEQVRLFTIDNDVIRALNQVKDADMYKKYNKMYQERLSDLSNANTNRKFREAGERLDELADEIEDYLYEHEKEIQKMFVFDENADDKITAFGLRVAQFMYDTFDDLDQSDMVKYIIEKSSKCPDDIIKTVTEKDYDSIGDKIFTMLIEDFDMDPEFIRQNKLVPLTIKIYLKHSNETLKEVSALLKHYDDEYSKNSDDKIFEEKENDNTEEEKEVRKDKKKKDKKNKKEKEEEEVKEETSEVEEETSVEDQEETVIDDKENEKEETSDEDETNKETNDNDQEEAATNDEENEEEIRKMFPETLKLFKSYKPVLEPYGKSGNEQKKEVSKEQIQESLKKIANAMDEFDLDAADEALKELDTYKLPDVVEEKMDELRAFIADVAMEDVMQLTQEMLGLL